MIEAQILKARGDAMQTQTVTVELPKPFYEMLQSLVADDQTQVADVIARLVEHAYHERAWRSNLTALQDQIRREGGLQVGTTKEAVVAQLRRTREALFEAEYAHLYR
jgi:Arc/MetJ-type ribon-helix-helix transcriptional regulator